MKKALVYAAFLTLTTSAVASAQVQTFRGSDTLFGATTQAINLSGLSGQIQYLGGGTGLGETALSRGEQGIAPMSRALRQAAIDAAAELGLTLAEYVLGLDAVVPWIRADQSPLYISIPNLRSIFAGQDGSGSASACADPARITDWAQVPDSGKTGTIRVCRRNDDSGTTDVFKTLVGITNFCSDVLVIATTAEIADYTSTEADSLCYAGLSGERVGQNRGLAVGATDAGPFIDWSIQSVRDFTFPLARRLYLNYIAAGPYAYTEAEAALFVNMIDRSFMDPILQGEDFVTCDPAVGCP